MMNITNDGGNSTKSAVHDDIEGRLVAQRLREISDQIVAYKAFLDVEPGNILIINLLEAERVALRKKYIRSISNEDNPN